VAGVKAFEPHLGLAAHIAALTSITRYRTNDTVCKIISNCGQHFWLSLPVTRYPAFIAEAKKLLGTNDICS
jgi:hypothetical protein